MRTLLSKYTAFALALSAPAAFAGERVDAPAPYENVCTRAAAEVAGVRWDEVLPGPSFAAPRGMRIAVLAGGHAMTCQITNGFRIVSLGYD